MTNHSICSRCTKKFDLISGKKISYAENIFYICKQCLPTTKDCKSKIYPFKKASFLSREDCKKIIYNSKQLISSTIK